MWEAIKFGRDYGVLGIVCVLLIFALLRVYNHARSDARSHMGQIRGVRDALSREQTARADDAKRFTDVALKLQAEVISSVASIDKASEENAKLGKLVEKLLAAVDRLIEENRSIRPPRRR